MVTMGGSGEADRSQVKQGLPPLIDRTEQLPILTLETVQINKEAGYVARRRPREMELPDKNLEQKLRKQRARRTGTEGRRTIKHQNYNSPGGDRLARGRIPEVERGRTDREAREATENTGQELRTEIAETKSA
jgi:hypothetical protein